MANITLDTNYQSKLDANLAIIFKKKIFPEGKQLKKIFLQIKNKIGVIKLGVRKRSNVINAD